jgi:hypothetical protein
MDEAVHELLNQAINVLADHQFLPTFVKSFVETEGVQVSIPQCVMMEIRSQEMDVAQPEQ